MYSPDNRFLAVGNLQLMIDFANIALNIVDWVCVYLLLKKLIFYSFISNQKLSI